MKRYLVITGDDFGFSTERNRGVMEAFNKGAIKSASVLLNCTGTDEAMKLFQTSSLCPGLHLNLTEGKPISTTPYTTLTDSTGIFHGMIDTPSLLDEGKIDKDETLNMATLHQAGSSKWLAERRIRLTASQFGQICKARDKNKIKQEIDAQIARFKELHTDTPVYVDGHQHVHIHEKVVDIFADALKRNNIQLTRYPVEINMPSKSWVNPELMPFFIEMINRAEKAKPVLDSYGIRYMDSYTGLSTMGADMTVDRLQQIITEAFLDAEQKMAAKPADQQRNFVTVELMTHPGYPTDPNFGGFSWGSDDFGMSGDRVHEINVLSSQAMMSYYTQNNIELVSHRVMLK